MLIKSPSSQSRITEGLKFLFDLTFSYSTVRQAKVNSISIAVIFRLFQIGIILYIIL